MLGLTPGMIGFPRYLLARENDDEVVQKKDRGQVALVTGEEKVLPTSTGYFLCTVASTPTVEGMPAAASTSRRRRPSSRPTTSASAAASPRH